MICFLLFYIYLFYGIPTICLYCLKLFQLLWLQIFIIEFVIEMQPTSAHFLPPMPPVSLPPILPLPASETGILLFPFSLNDNF